MAEPPTRDGDDPDNAVTVDDLARLAETCADLADPEVMARAWQ